MKKGVCILMLGSKGLIQHAKLQPKKGLLALTGKYDGT